MAADDQRADDPTMVRSIAKAYIWLAALWSCGGLVHAGIPSVPEVIGLAAGLAAAAWFVAPVLRQAGARLTRNPAARAGELVTIEHPLSGG